MITDVKEAEKFSFSPLSSILGMRLTQIREEISALLSILKKIQPQYILEIGTGSGGTFFLFTRVAESNAILITIDLPGGPFGGGYPEWKIPLFKSFARGDQKIYLIRLTPITLRHLTKLGEF